VSAPGSTKNPGLPAVECLPPFRRPVAPPAGTARKAPARGPTALAAQPSAPNAETILLAEDEDAILGILTIALSSQGYTVLSAKTAAEARDVAARYAGAIDLVVTDVHLPDEPGPQLVQSLQAARPGLKALYISGYPQATLVQAGTLTGGEPFLQKPFSPSGLVRKIQVVLGP
jgi:two-component system cell cycle sensor histidine kinase/response regulator CckA